MLRHRSRRRLPVQSPSATACRGMVSLISSCVRLALNQAKASVCSANLWRHWETTKNVVRAPVPGDCVRGDGSFNGLVLARPQDNLTANLTTGVGDGMDVGIGVAAAQVADQLRQRVPREGTYQVGGGDRDL